MNLSPMEQYWIWLSSIEGISLKRFYQLISVYGDARAVWDNASDDKMKEILAPAALNKLRAVQGVYDATLVSYSGESA